MQTKPSEIEFGILIILTELLDVNIVKNGTA